MSFQAWSNMTWLLVMGSLIATVLLIAKGNWEAAVLAFMLSGTMYALLNSETRNHHR